MALTVYDSAGNPRTVLALWVSDGSSMRSVPAAWVSDGAAMRQVVAPGGGRVLAAPTGLQATNLSECQDQTPVYRVLVHWTNSESDCYTELYEGGVLAYTYAPGEVGANLALGAGTYTFTVRHRHPFNASLRSDHSAPATVTVYVLDCAPPDPDLQVVDLQACGTYKARLAWLNTVPRNMRVYRDGVQVHVSTYPATEWTDEVATAGPHTWYVEHVPSDSALDHEPGPSNAVTLTLQQDCTPVGPAAPPAIGSATNQSQCEGVDPVNGQLGTPLYQARIIWSVGDLLATTEVLVDGAVRVTAPMEATEAIIPMYQPGTYAITVRHVRNGIPSAASGPLSITIGSLPCDTGP